MFPNKERGILNDLIIKYRKDLRNHNNGNFVFPLICIGGTLVGVISYHGLQPADNFFQSLFNGSLPLLAINLCAGAFFLLINHNKGVELSSDDFKSIRSRLILYTLVLLGFSIVLYVAQNIFSPFNDLFKWIQIVCSILVIILSYFLFNRFFVLQEEFIKHSRYGLNQAGEKDLNANRMENGFLKDEL